MHSTPARTVTRSALGLVTGVLLLAGCSSGPAGTQASSPAARRATAAGLSAGTSGAQVTGVAPSPRKVCDGRSIPDVVRQVEPSVVTVRTSKGLGSGIAFRSHVIITDQHVVAVHEGRPQVVPKVQIDLADGSTIPGTVIGSDLLTDVAVIKVKRSLPPLPFATGLPAQGQTVLAIGSPLGLSSTVTEGIVSALGRDLPGGSSSLPLVDLIQTDAAISPGNSGGALLNTCGQVVGVNEAYIPPQAGAVSLGFATPAPVATHIADQLITSGHASHPYLGVKLTNLTARVAHALGTGVDSGVVVVGVVPGSPADHAGVQRGDIITRFDGHRVTDYATLLGQLRTTRPGTTVALTVSRGGHDKQVHLTVGTRKATG